MDASDRTFDLVILADFCPGRQLPFTPERVDRDTLGEVTKHLAPALDLGGATLAFDDGRAFRPETLAAALPITQGLLALRRRLKTSPPPSGTELKTQIEKLAGESAGALRAVFGSDAAPAPAAATPAPAPTAASRPASGDPLDDILGMVDAGAPAATPAAPAAASMLDRLIRSAADLSKSPDAVPNATLRALEQAVDDTMSGTLRAALHDPAFQAVEAAWTGLRFLVRRVDFRTGVRLHVVPCTRATLAAAFREGVAPFAAEQRRESRTVAAIADFEFGLDDVAALAELALDAERARVPLIANAAPSLLGLDALSQLDRLDDAGDTLADEARVDWSGLRDEECSRWLALAINRVLLRSPYGAEQERVREFAFEENPIGEDAGYLWGGPAWAIAALLVASIERGGWGTEIAGNAEERTLGDLPVRPLSLKTGETLPCPLEILMTEKRALELSRGGLIPLASRRARDDAFAPTAPVVRRAGVRSERPDEADTRRATLAYTMFLAQVSAQIEHLAAWVDRSRPAEEIARAVAQGIELLNTSSAGAELRVTAEPAGDAAVALTLQPQAGPLRGLPATRLEIPL